MKLHVNLIVKVVVRKKDQSSSTVNKHTWEQELKPIMGEQKQIGLKQ